MARAEKPGPSSLCGGVGVRIPRDRAWGFLRSGTDREAAEATAKGVPWLPGSILQMLKLPDREAAGVVSRLQRHRGRCRLEAAEATAKGVPWLPGSILQMLKLPDREAAGRGHAQTPGNVCDSRAMPSRPREHPVAKSPGGEHATAGEPMRHRLEATRIPRGFLAGDHAGSGSIVADIEPFERAINRSAPKAWI